VFARHPERESVAKKAKYEAYRRKGKASSDPEINKRRNRRKWTVCRGSGNI